MADNTENLVMAAADSSIRAVLRTQAELGKNLCRNHDAMVHSGNMSLSEAKTKVRDIIVDPEVFIVGFISTRMSRVVRRIQTAIETLESEDLSVRSVVITLDEFGDNANSCNSMAILLDSSFQLIMKTAELHRILTDELVAHTVDVKK